MTANEKGILKAIQEFRGDQVIRSKVNKTSGRQQSHLQKDQSSYFPPHFYQEKTVPEAQDKLDKLRIDDIRKQKIEEDLKKYEPHSVQTYTAVKQKLITSPRQMLKEITRIQENTNMKRTLATSENSYHAGSRFMNTMNPKAMQTIS